MFSLCVCVCSDLSCVQDLQVVILNTFSSQSEEVRSAASYALGTCTLYTYESDKNVQYMLRGY